MVPISQAQSFGDIHLEGQGNTLTINQIIQIAVAEIKTRDFIPSSPYIGLQPFGENNKDAFFGRDQLVGKLLRLVSQHNLVLLAGASGSGKSSVVRAGLLPQLNARLDQGRFNALTFTPDRDPFQSLRGALNTAAGVPQEDLDGLEARTAESLVTTLTSQRPADVLWLLFIDQFEQIFTRCADAEQREAFILGLTRLAQSSQSEIKIVLAMRADFFDRFGPYPEFGALAQEGIQLALDMQASELRAAIEQPAARHGVVFEEGLVEQIIASIKDRPGTLPLLQYTLDLLWREDKPENDRTLNTNSYLRIGGIEGALKQRADAIYRFAKAKKQIERSPAQREALRQIFLHVVDLTSPGAEAHAVSRRTSLDAFPRAEDRQLISELVDEKLLVSNAPLPDKNGQPSRSATIEVAHEALLSAWPLLKDWIEQAREVIYVRNRLAADARRFVEVTACTPALAADELWVGTRLAQALELRACGDFRTLLGGLCPEEESFLDASEARKARLEREATEQLRREREAAEKNRQLLLDSYIDRGHQLLFDKGDPYAAALWLHRAYKQESQNPILPHLLKTAMQHVDVTRAVLSGHQDRVTSARFSPDGRRIVTASDDNTARIWDGEIGRMLIELRGHENRVISVRFGPNGQRILTASLDRTARLWDPESGFLLATLVGHKHAVVDALFSLDGRRILTFSADPIVSPQQDHSAMIWDAEGQLLGELISPQSSIVLARFSPDGQRIFTLSYDGAVRIWDVESGRVLTEFRCPDGPITSASYSPDGQRIIIGIPTFTSRAQLRNAEDGKLNQAPPQTRNNVKG